MNDKKISKAMREEIIQNTKEAPKFTREKRLEVGQSMKNPKISLSIKFQIRFNLLFIDLRKVHFFFF